MTVSVAIVGSGPRGISLLQRLSTRLQSVNYAPDSSLSFVLHIFDCSYLGAGRIWNPDQVKVLRMNTPANSVTLFPQEAGCSDSNSPTGPNLYEWVQLVRGDLAPEEIKFNYGNKLLKSFQVLRSDVASLYESTISDLSPNDFVPRSLYGEYLRWVYDTSITQMPSWVKLHQYRQEVVDISPKKGRDLLILKDGSSVTADITMLATGWASSSRTINEPSQRHTTVPFVPAANPAEQDLGVLRSGQTTVVQGFGTCFFDLMALVTEGRGGKFHEDATSRSGLRYEASGREPHLAVTSRHGSPYLAKPSFSNSSSFRFPSLIPERLSSITDSPSFDLQIWPQIVKAAYAAYYLTLDRVRPEALLEPIVSILDTIESSDPTDFCGDGLLATVPNELARLLRTASREPLDLASWINPLENTHDYTLDELRSLVAKQLKQDIDEAAAGGFSPIKAALNEVAIARQHVSLLFQNGVTHDQDGNKLRKDFMKFGQMVGSGPPLFRSRQLLALIDAGVVTPVGPSPSVEVVDSDVRVTSGSRTIAGSSLANAFLPGPDVRRHTDPLTESLMSRGRIRPFKIGEKLTGSPETDALTHRVVGPNGCLDSRLHIVGVPTRAQWADTILSPRPEPNSLFLQETDHIAASVVNRLIDES